MNLCQYCRAPVEGPYTCKECSEGWPIEACRCENNGDYCEICELWIAYRSLKASLSPKRMEGSRHE